VPSKLHTITWKRGPLTVRDVWYDAQAPADADVIYYMQMNERVAGEAYEQFTLLNDLQQTEEELFSAIGKSCREKIRSMENRSDLKFELHTEPDEKVYRQFLDEYEAFTRVKKIAAPEVLRLDAYRRNGLLALSRVSDAENKTYVWHAYRLNSERVYLVYTVSMWFRFEESAAKNRIGKANRWAHWKDMQEFKKLGVRWYDWGGWYNGKTDEELLSINRFKEEFGGSVKENYNSIAYPSWKGKLFRLLKGFKK